ncbi:MAG: hypothetical protein KAY78_02830 [Pseudomonadales bacterium]|nr:hypothetical protein [Pseudomonadales bacterium]
MAEPITLKFYGDGEDPNEVKETHTLHRVKTKFLKMAIRLKKELGDPNEMGEEQINMLLNFIVDLFDGKFTSEDLEEHTDLFECYAVLGSIFGRANGLAVQFAGNPTPPSLKKK